MLHLSLSARRGHFAHDDCLFTYHPTRLSDNSYGKGSCDLTLQSCDGSRKGCFHIGEVPTLTDMDTQQRLDFIVHHSCTHTHMHTHTHTHTDAAYSVYYRTVLTHSPYCSAMFLWSSLRPHPVQRAPPAKSTQRLSTITLWPSSPLQS